MIKFGSFEYFVLLDLRDKLKYRDYDRLDLITIDKLRNEVEIKIAQIHLVEDKERNAKKNSKEKE